MVWTIWPGFHWLISTALQHQPIGIDLGPKTLGRTPTILYTKRAMKRKINIRQCHETKYLFCVAGLSVALALSAPAQSTMVTFDDLPTGSNGTDAFAGIPNGYAGLNWSGLVAVNAVGYVSEFANFNMFAAFSAPNAATTVPLYTNSATGTPILDDSHTSGEISSSQPFGLVSAYFAAVCRTGLMLEVKGFDGDTQLYDQTYALGNSYQFITLNLDGITDVQFYASGGQWDGLASLDGLQFTMDNLTVVTAPEPSSLCLLGLAGAGGFGLWHRHRTRA
jgi:hypothetical protein